jgi:uncharacterized RDD family membrane protein YckC
MSQQPSGWYDDPSNPEMLRYWDGVMWTDHTAPKKSPTLPQSSQSTIGLPQQQDPSVPQAPQAPQPPQPTAPMQQGGWQGQNAPQQYPPQYQQYPQAPGAAAWMNAGPSTADGVPLASWGRRVVARILDNIITGIISAIVGWSWLSDLITWYTDIIRRAADTGVAPDATTMTTEMSKYLVPLVIVGLVVGVVYETFFLTRVGATPGKMALGMSVRRTGAAGPLDLVSALKRQVIQVLASATNASPVLGSLFSILTLLDYLWPLWDGRRQALHDKLADTQVVMGKQPPKQG